MLQVYLVRHGETLWNVQQRIQGHSDSPLTEKGQYQASLVAQRVQHLGITHIISSDLGRTRQTASIISKGSGSDCLVLTDPRLRELNMGILEQREMRSLNQQEEYWRRQVINGTPGGRIPDGESLQELTGRMLAALNACLRLPEGSRPLLVSHGIALGCLISSILGVPAGSERRLRLRNCSISRVDYQQSSWLAAGWVVETAGDISHLDSPALDELQVCG